MPTLIAYIVIFTAVLVLYLLFNLEPLHSNPQKPRKLKKATIPTRIQPEFPRTMAPFLYFNSIKIERTYSMPKGTRVIKNFYIVEGRVEMRYNNSVIGMLRAGQITHNCFDLLKANIGIVKTAATDLLVAEMPENTENYVNVKIFEKTCILPQLLLFNNHELVARLETIKTSNFEDFLERNLGIKGVRVETFAVKAKPDLDRCLYYVHSGSLIVNNVVFERGSVFGYLGLFCNNYRGFRCTAAVHTILKCVPYGKLGGREFDIRNIKTFPLPLVVLGATVEWQRIASGQTVFEKDEKCDDIYLVDGEAHGCRECILKGSFEKTLVAEKTVDVVRVPRGTVEILLKNAPELYEVLIGKMFGAARTGAKTVLITPAGRSNDQFIYRLKKAIGSNATVIRNTHISRILRRNAFDGAGELMVTEYLRREQETTKAVVVYLENEYSRLLKIIHPYCDMVFIVGSEVVQNSLDRTNVEFVRLYEGRHGGTKAATRGTGGAFLGRLFSEPEEESEEEEINPLEAGEEPMFRRVHHILSPNEMNFCNRDYERFARYILGERIGLVLGGGGARGYAHIGVIQALEEENIPIDVIGGTSMGAFVGALYARSLDYVDAYREAKSMAKVGSSFLSFLFEFTFPFVSIFSGRSLDRKLRSIFRGQQIQNFWLEYYCVTTSLKTLGQSVHFNGSAFKYIRSSMAVAGLVPPVFYNDDILCDGAYVNNVPTDVMQSLDVKNIVSVKVCQDFDNRAVPYDSRSGLVLLLKSLLFSRPYLTLAETQYRLSYLTMTKWIGVLSTQNLVIQPDLSAYKPLDFHKFDEIVACGYKAAKVKIKEWKASGKIGTFRLQHRRFSI